MQFLAYDVLDQDLFVLNFLKSSAIFIKADPEIIAEIKKDIMYLCWNFHKARRYPYQTIQRTWLHHFNRFISLLKLPPRFCCPITFLPKVVARYLVKQSSDVSHPCSLHERMNAAGTPDT